MQEKVKTVIEEIRLLLQDHGGDIELVKIEDNKVFVRLQGACSGCPGARMTMKQGVERRVKQAVPEVVGVEAVD